MPFSSARTCPFAVFITLAGPSAAAPVANARTSPIAIATRFISPPLLDGPGRPHVLRPDAKHTGRHAYSAEKTITGPEAMADGGAARESAESKLTQTRIGVAGHIPRLPLIFHA